MSSDNTVRSYSLEPDRDLTILIPARAGSLRVLGKNTRLLGNRPLFMWTVKAAQAANVADIIVSTDDPVVELDADGQCLIHDRKPEHATAGSPDIEWVLDVLPMVHTPYIAICRPTSPFRTASTIRRCYAAFLGSGADSIRAVTRVMHPHPAKMWQLDGKLMRPVMAGCHPDGTPYHSSPTQSLPEVFVQNASLEMTSVANVHATKTISGIRIAPFFTDDREGFDLNTEADWLEAVRIAATVVK